LSVLSIRTTVVLYLELKCNLLGCLNACHIFMPYNGDDNNNDNNDTSHLHMHEAVARTAWSDSIVPSRNTESTAWYSYTVDTFNNRLVRHYLHFRGFTYKSYRPISSLCWPFNLSSGFTLNYVQYIYLYLLDTIIYSSRCKKSVCTIVHQGWDWRGGEGRGKREGQLQVNVRSDLTLLVFTECIIF